MRALENLKINWEGINRAAAHKCQLEGELVLVVVVVVHLEHQIITLEALLCKLLLIRMELVDRPEQDGRLDLWVRI